MQVDIRPGRLRGAATAGAASTGVGYIGSTYQTNAVGDFALQYIDTITIVGDPGQTVDVELGAIFHPQNSTATASAPFSASGAATVVAQEVLFSGFGVGPSLNIAFSNLCKSVDGCLSSQKSFSQIVTLPINYSFAVSGRLNGSAEAGVILRYEGSPAAQAAVNALNTSQARIRVLTPGASFISEGQGTYELNFVAAPEPSSLVLFGTTLGVFAVMIRRKAKL